MKHSDEVKYFIIWTVASLQNYCFLSEEKNTKSRFSECNKTFRVAEFFNKIDSVSILTSWLDSLDVWKWIVFLLKYIKYQ